MVDVNSERLGKEVRKHVRIEVELEVDFTLVGDERGTIYRGVTKNIGGGGICLLVSTHQNEIKEIVGKQLPFLKVTLHKIAENAPLDVDAKTAWLRTRVGWMYSPSDRNSPVLMGMAFVDLNETEQEKINLFIADELMKQREPVPDVERRIISQTFNE